MLVIWRRRDESIVIGDEVTVTVREIGDEWVQLWIEGPGGVGRGAILENGDWTEVAPDMPMTLVAVREDKARLGIEAPNHFPIHRGEVYEALHAASVPAEVEGACFLSGEVEPMYERFTDRARKIMQLANQEAQHFNHEYIGTEHILLGLVKEGSGVAANVLKNLDVDLGKIRLEVEKLVQTGSEMVTIGGKLPHTPRAKKVIEYSMEEARALGHNYVGTEHLLLGLLREPEGVAAQVLMNLGLDLHAVRQEVLNLLGHGMEAETRRPILWWQQSLSEAAFAILEQARREAQQRNEGVISTGHLLLGLLAKECLPGAVLQQLGVSSDAVKTEMDKLLFESPPWSQVTSPLLASRLTAALDSAGEGAWDRSGKQELKDRLEAMNREKEEAVAVQDFERAAGARDQADAIKKKIGGEPPRAEPADLLLALLRQSDSAAVRIIQNLGLHPEHVRAEVLRRLGEQTG